MVSSYGNIVTQLSFPFVDKTLFYSPCGETLRYGKFACQYMYYELDVPRMCPHHIKFLVEWHDHEVGYEYDASDKELTWE